MIDKEKIYDEQIFPKMKEILEICKKENIPMIAEFQYSDDGFCKSVIKSGDSHPMFTFLDALSQCIEEDGMNIDKFLLWMLREAGDNHSSLMLHKLNQKDS
jgi:hypothetical protein